MGIKTQGRECKDRVARNSDHRIIESLSIPAVSRSKKEENSSRIFLLSPPSDHCMAAQIFWIILGDLRESVSIIRSADSGLAKREGSGRSDVDSNSSPPSPPQKSEKLAESRRDLP